LNTFEDEAHKNALGNRYKESLIPKKECPSLKIGIKSTPFLIIYFSTLVVSLLALFIGVNFKQYGLTKVKSSY